MAAERSMTEHEQWLVGQGKRELAEQMRDLRGRFHEGDLVELIDDARAGAHVPKGDLPDEFMANVTYKLHDLCGLFLRFKKDDNRSLWRVSSAPFSRLPYQTAHSRFFQPVARDTAVPTKIAALSTVFEKLQGDQVRGLKRKLEETTLAMERASMEREDFAQGNAVVYPYLSPPQTWRSNNSNMCRTMNERNDTIESVVNIVRGADGGTAQDQEDALAQIRIELQAMYEGESEEGESEEMGDEPEVEMVT